MAQPILEAFEKCQRRYPTVRLPIDAFEARIKEILAPGFPTPGDAAWNQAFEKIHHEDLYLALACAHDDGVAWEHFVDDYVPLLRHFASQVCGGPGESEDLAQEITAKLLKDKSRLAGYGGRGSLAGWLRVAVAHAAIDRFRHCSRTSSLEELQESGFTPAVAPEADNGEELDSHWGPVMTGTAEECLRALPARDRLLLCLYYLQGVPLKDIGRQFGVHEATASRWLERLRHDIRKQVERELRKKYGLRSSEIESLWKWVSPGSLARSVDGSPMGTDANPRDAVSQTQKKAAIGERSGVIEKEGLQ